MKKLLCVFLTMLCIISLFGCSRENLEEILITQDISSITDFKCVFSTDNETEFVMEGDDAKELYSFVTEKRQYAEQTGMDRTEQKCISLSFQGGEPLYILCQESKADLPDGFAVPEVFDYDVFWICENDYVVYVPMPTVSAQQYYKFPKGTYEKVLEMLQY